MAGDVFVVGVSWRTAPVAVRERLQRGPRQRDRSTMGDPPLDIRGSLRRRVQAPATRDLAQHDAAPPLGVVLAQPCERLDHVVAAGLAGLGHLLDR